jgi:hypothetical protein
MAGNGRTARQRWALPFLISAILHLVVLSQINWSGLQVKLGKQHRLNVSLIPPSLPDERTSLGESERSQSVSSSAQTVASASVLDANEGDYRLDMSQIRNQARDYANQQFASSDRSLPLSGDYYGTYTGDDSGLFFFHLDANGQVSGSGESTALGIVFMISGNILPNGVIHMVGRKKEAKASLSGKLDAKTGKISGSWFVSGMAEGLFSGQHEY